MAPPTAVVEGGDTAAAPQGRQQAGGGFSFTGIIRMVVFWYFASKFFSPASKKSPNNEPAVLISNLFLKAQPMVHTLSPFHSIVDLSSITLFNSDFDSYIY